MIKRQIFGFLAHWLLSSLGMWICITLFGTIIGDYTIGSYLIAGLIFSLINLIVRPLATMFSLPLIIFTMGLFTIIINTAMFALTIYLLPHVEMDFLGVLISSLIMSIANGVVNFWATPYNKE